MAMDKQLVMGLLFSIVQCTLTLFEFLFGLAALRQMIRHAFDAVVSDPASPLYTVAANALSTAIICGWCLTRFGWTVNLSLSELAKRLGVWRPRLTRTGLGIIGLQFVGAAVMVGVQYASKEWLYSTANYYKEGVIDWNGIVDMLVLSPLREELVFRAILFCVFYRSLGDGTSRSKLWSVAASALAFGGIHLLNLFGTKYTPSYIALQMTLGTLFGLLYGLRLLLAGGNVWEPIILHVTNNLIASFLPADFSFDWSKPLHLLPLLETLAMYGVLIFSQWRHVAAAPANALPAPVFDAAEGGHSIPTVRTAAAAADTSSVSSSSRDSKEKGGVRRRAGRR